MSKGYGFIIPDNGPDILLHVVPATRRLPGRAWSRYYSASRPAGRSASFRWTNRLPFIPQMAPRTHATVTATSGLERAQVKWFNRLRGFGFLTRGEGTPDIFVHMETLRRYGLTELRPGQFVLVRFGPGPKGMMAAEVRPDGQRPRLPLIATLDAPLADAVLAVRQANAARRSAACHCYHRHRPIEVHALPSVVRASRAVLLLLPPDPAGILCQQLQTVEIASRTGVHVFAVEMAVTPGAGEGPHVPSRSAGRARNVVRFRSRAAGELLDEEHLRLLDMIFIRADGRILRIAESTVPLSETLVHSGGPVRAVLEVVAGTARARHRSRRPGGASDLQDARCSARLAGIDRTVYRVRAPRRRGIAQPGSAGVLGTPGRRFESCCPDQGAAEDRTVRRIGHATMPARIYKPARSAMQSGLAKPRTGCSTTSRKSRPDRAAHGLDELRDMRQQVQLRSDTVEEAIAYRERHRIPYRVFEHRPAARRAISYADNFAFKRRDPWTH